MTISTALPGGEPGEFVNLLDPALELYDAAGNLVASNADGLDGRNALLTYFADAGTYKLRVVATSGAGEYVVTYSAVYDGAPPTVAPIADRTINEDGAAVVDSVSNPEPGRAVVTFHATGDDLNTLIPGPFLAISVPTRADVPVGSHYDVILGAGTAVLDGNGQLVDVEMEEPEVLKFVRARLQFTSGFDDGTSDDFWPDDSN